jgi:flavin-dependent dehydrogenase
MNRSEVAAKESLVAIALMLCLTCTTAGAEFVTEPAKRIPVLFDADVVVAGGGVSGIFAAIAAARNGAKTVLIERASSVGGNSGPGLNPGGGVQLPGPYKDTGDGYPKIWIYPEIAGIPKEFAERLQALNKQHLAARPHNTLNLSNSISYLGTKMLKEAGVELLLSTDATDPIMEGNTVKGVFVENKSGRRASGPRS